jgi:hypothetical protein
VGSEVSEWELRERRQREEERRAEAEELGGNNPCSSPRPPSWRPRTRFRERITVSFLLSFFYLLGTGLGRGQRGACNVPPSRGLRTGKPDSLYLAMIYLGRMRVMNKQKKKHDVGWRRALYPLSRGRAGLMIHWLMLSPAMSGWKACVVSRILRLERGVCCIPYLLRARLTIH